MSRSLPATPVSRSFGAVVSVGLAAVIMAVAACSVPPPPSTTQPSKSSSPAAAGQFAGLIDVGGRKLYLECRGSGSPTVILQSGFGNAADIWSYTEARPPPVLPGTATFARVCAYDRPGSIRTLDDAGHPAPTPLPSRSDPAPMPRTGADVVTELRDLLATAGVPGPYVLTGHSLGGVFNLLYARTYPDQVAGLVMVDATPPPLKKLLSPQLWKELVQDPLLAPESPIPDYVMEAYNLDLIIEQIDSAAPLPQAPVVLLAATEMQPGAPPALRKALAPLAPKAQAEFAASIPNARLTRVPKTSHYIQLQRPHVVIDTIRSVSAQSR